jgi:hypothetical protein
VSRRECDSRPPRARLRLTSYQTIKESSQQRCEFRIDVADEEANGTRKESLTKYFGRGSSKVVSSPREGGVSCCLGALRESVCIVAESPEKPVAGEAEKPTNTTACVIVVDVRARCLFEKRLKTNRASCTLDFEKISIRGLCEPILLTQLSIEGCRSPAGATAEPSALRDEGALRPAHLAWRRSADERCAVRLPHSPIVHLF